MNKVTRMLVMTGMAFAASATIGAGAASAAQAAPAAPASPSADSSAAKSNGDHRFGRTKIIGYYRSPILCHRVGNLGEWKNRWDDHECKRVRTPFHRGSWVLLARWDSHGWNNHGGGNWNNHGGPGNWNNNGGPGNWNNHGGPGQHGPNFPGNNPWNQKKH